MFVKIVLVHVGDDAVEVNAAHIASVRPHRENGELTGAVEVRMANGAAIIGRPDFDSLASFFCSLCGFPLGDGGKCIMPLCLGGAASVRSAGAQLDEGPASETPAGESPAV